MPRLVFAGLPFALSAVVSFAAAHKPSPIGYALHPVRLNEVALAAGFWSKRIHTHTHVTIPHILKTLNIDYANPQPDRSALALVRTLEGAAYCLMMEDDPKLRDMMEKISKNIGGLYRGGNRWFGGCPEAAAYLSLVTGKENEWLKEAINEYRQRDGEYFGKDGKFLKEPESHAYYGMAIISLYQATGDEYYKNLAQKFMDIRGMPATGQRTWPKFAAQHQPVEKMNEPGGHAGSFGWFAAALVDVGALTGDKKYGAAAERIWRNMVDTRVCITGGTGAVSRWEGFGEPYKIGRGGYNETCAASGQVFYNYRLGMLTKDGRYFDTMEVVLFNGLLSGVSLSGDKFFYANILESGGRAARRDDRRVPCCHGSIARTIPQVPGYMYAHTASDIYAILYANNSATFSLPSGKVRIEQRTAYPFDGQINLKVNPSKHGQKFAVRLRIPAWARKKFMPGALYSFIHPPKQKWTAKVNGESVTAKLEKGFAVIERTWSAGDTVQLNLPMPVQFSTCIAKVAAYRNRVAVTRGPLVYCAEEIDNGGPVQRLAIPKTPIAPQVKVTAINDGPLKGVNMIQLPGADRTDGKDRPMNISLVPYYSWENRGSKTMSVWIPQGTVPLGEPVKWIPTADAKAAPRSRPGNDGALIFQNKSGRRVKLFWVSYKNKLQSYGELKPGETRRQGTFANNTWLITDESDQPLGYFIAAPREAPAIIPAGK